MKAVLTFASLPMLLNYLVLRNKSSFVIFNSAVLQRQCCVHASHAYVTLYRQIKTGKLHNPETHLSTWIIMLW